MRFALKHLFLLLLVLIVAGFFAFQLLRTKPDKTPPPVPSVTTTFSIQVAQQPGSDFLQLVVQKLNPAKGTPAGQEVFTLQRVGATPTIIHYTSTAPDFLSPVAISQQRPDGTALPLEQQAALHAWLRGQWQSRLEKLDQVLQQKTKLGIFAALQLVQDGKLPSAGTPQELLPWIVLPPKQAPNNDSPKTSPRDLQVQLVLDAETFENPETFAKRLASEYQQRTSPSK
jgi:hypothetical protein